MKSCTLPAVRVEPELRAELESVLGKGETISTFVADAVRRAVDSRRVQTHFRARGEAAWQDYLRTGVSHPVDEVFDRLQARIDARRRELQSPST
ncbi:Arc/MetJ-type ribon-helix-helix transcriptional regulator [Variovorax paradoxus]|uniref:Arc/MetJ-type ribon-helix-helix transcriptional regulator n=1 Tax=Variovorax paradoxus TaxID=34073 RepID=A0AAE3Y6A3_VARPD|nr:YlcI/YnfO family protein [Variovorax paradoxus]MDP9965377.1 Arc/MetJ-type ribon-helix-helix transcriptional regulator [Variovorax paradoxus]MDR6429956.1 Arc/MetJ-type ribon-helix-helix transcriptional regulator [Variovorax paradoxus]MDR6456520.1 Arc/MetJ-type ribon-helix-helix transcriptional regulator [Variovorax paradoxus]